MGLKVKKNRRRTQLGRSREKRRGKAPWRSWGELLRAARDGAALGRALSPLGVQAGLVRRLVRMRRLSHASRHQRSCGCADGSTGCV